MHREDKEMRGHSNVTMCEWLINSFFTFCNWTILNSAGPEGTDADIQMKRDATMYLRRITTLLLEFILRWNSFKMCFQAHFGALIYLVAMNY